MNVKSILGSYIGHLAGYVLAGADIVSKVNPSLLPPQYGLLISVAGLVTIATHHGYQAGTAGVQAAVDAATKALKSTAPVLLICLLAAGFLAGCKTAPNAQQSAGITIAVDVATGAAIQNGVHCAVSTTSPPQFDCSDAYKSRAAEFKAIAVEVKTVNDAGTATLATLAADIAPLIDRLPPADQLAAHALVAALTPYLNAELQGNDGLRNVQTTLDVILQAVIDSCAAYGA